MRILTVQGRVVTDAQVKSSAKGRAYIEFRFANNEYKDEEGSTFWMRAVSFDPSHINLAQFITKGKPLILTGNYSNKVYAAKDGACQVDNNLVLTGIYFIDSNKKDEGTSTTTQPPKTEEAPVVTTPKGTKKTEPKVTSKPTPEVTDEEDDDLPF